MVIYVNIHIYYMVLSDSVVNRWIYNVCLRGWRLRPKWWIWRNELDKWICSVESLWCRILVPSPFRKECTVVLWMVGGVTRRQYFRRCVLYIVEQVSCFPPSITIAHVFYHQKIGDFVNMSAMNREVYTNTSSRQWFSLYSVTSWILNIL